MPGRRPLLRAIDSGDLEEVRRILDAGARDLDTPSSRHDGRTPLGIAVAGGSAAIVRLLLAAGADPRSSGRSMGPPLYDAPTVEIARMLLDAGAPVEDDAVEDGLTPLMAAANDGRLDVVQLLIEAGADPLRISDGDDAHYFAARWGRDEVAAYLEQFYPTEAERRQARESGARGRALLERLGHTIPPEG